MLSTQAKRQAPSCSGDIPWGTWRDAVNGPTPGSVKYLQLPLEQYMGCLDLLNLKTQTLLKMDQDGTGILSISSQSLPS